jgi:hypothetical protein
MCHCHPVCCIVLYCTDLELIKFLLLLVVNVAVNVEKPECNGPFLVYDVPNMKCIDGVNDECRGFYIILPIDSRFDQMDDETNWYTESVTSCGTKLLFKVPGCPFGLFPKGKHSSFLYNQIVKQLDNACALFYE